MFRQQPSLDVGDDLGNSLGFGDFDAGLGRFPGAVIRPVVTQSVRQAGGDMQLPVLATGGMNSLPPSGSIKTAAQWPS